MANKNTLIWIPLWVDKWLFGSTRLELNPSERGIWIDMLALAAKDNGYIRANETVPYSDEQLAGLLCISVDLFRGTVNKCLDPKINKLEKTQHGTLHIVNWDQYQFSERHIRRVMSEKTDIVSRSEDPIVKNRIEKNINSCEKKVFEEFWKTYPSRNGKKLLKKEAQDYFGKNIKDKEFSLLMKAVHNYANSKECRNGYAKDAIRWLRNDRWREWLEPEKEVMKKASRCVYDNNKPCYKDCKGCKEIDT